MKPIAIFQHTSIGAPGTVLPILKDLGLQTQVIRVDRGEPIPDRPDEYSGLIFMGGYMSVYDPLPWINQEIELIRQADTAGIPVSGHCLGSQLLAVACGAKVGKNHRPEIGWHDIKIEANAVAMEWWRCEPGSNLLSFQWHSDTFSLPGRAVRIASNEACQNQAFVIGDRHIGMQSHFEMTPELVEAYVFKNGAFLKREREAANPSVTSEDEMFNNIEERTSQMATTLRRVYERWVKGLRTI